MYGSEEMQSGSLSSPLLGDDLEVTVRQGFVRKVFGILGAQLLTTFVISLPFVIYQDSTTAFLANNTWVPMIAMISLLASCLVLCCAPNLMRKFPTNYVIMSIFTVAEGILVGCATLAYKTDSVLIALGITAAVVIGLMSFAMQTKYDFTGMAPYLFVALIVFVLIGFVMMFFPSPFSQKLYAGMGAMLFSMYIVYDTQLIVGGKNRQIQYSIDDYCMAALNIYIDIIQLFLYLLQLFGDRRD